MSSYVLDGCLVPEPREDISAFNFINFSPRILIDEFVNMHETTTNSHKDLVALFNLYKDTLLSKLIDTFAFSQEHYV